MRKIEKQMLAAVVSGHNWKHANTEVFHSEVIGGAEVFLHGNHIATIYPSGEHEVNMETFARWPTRTTKSRLRALGVSFEKVKV